MQKQVSAIKKVIDLSLIFTKTSVRPFDWVVHKIIILVLHKSVETLAVLSALPLQLLHSFVFHLRLPQDFSELFCHR